MFSPPVKSEPVKETVYIDPVLMQKTISILPNNFVEFLQKKFGQGVVSQLVHRYKIGTSKHFGGAATIFWQVDENQNIHAGKIMQYHTATGKRIKEPHSLVTWVHKVAQIPNYDFSQCLFGLHLLNEPENENKPIGICESEKSAIIASIYLPDILWLACGSLSGLTAAKFKPLTGRRVILVPDTNGFKIWQEKALTLKKEFPLINVSDLLERNCTPEEKQKGYDLADYLLQNDLRLFGEHIETLKDGREILINSFGYPCMWDEKPCQPDSAPTQVDNQKSIEIPETTSPTPIQDEKPPPQKTSLLLPNGKYWYTGGGLWTKKELDKYNVRHN